MHQRTVLFTVLMSALVGSAAAESSTPKDVGTTRVVVAALKDERVAEEAATSLSQVDSETMERVGATNLSNALRYEAGVNVDMTSTGRMENVRIRGVGDDRVMIAIDGAPIPMAFKFGGGYTDMGQGYFDVDAMKRIDIIKGPVSMLYGSSALAGGIFMETKDPSDFIREGQRYGGEVKFGYGTADRDQLVTATAAAKITDTLSAFVRASFRKHYERRNYEGKAYSENLLGAGRTHPNPAEANVKNILSKVVFEPSDAHRFALSYEYFNSHAWDDAANKIGEKPMAFPGMPTFSAHHTNMLNIRQQVNLRYDFNVETPMFDRGHVMGYYQSTKARQSVTEAREHTARGVFTEDRFRQSHFKNEQVGFNTEFYKALKTGSISHELSYGANYKHTKVKTLRLGHSFNRQTGASTETQTFPNKSFPDSKIHEYGLFAQDRIGFLDNRLEVILGLRYDHYSLKVQQGGPFLEANPGVLAPVGLNKGHLSKRLAVLYYPHDHHTIYANYAEGFKAPSFNAVNVGFSNLAHGYTAISNPDLKPETSKTFELGWNFNDEINSASVAAFYTKYDNFIEELKVVGHRNGVRLHQSVNLDKSHIYGLEGKASIRVLELQNNDAELRLNLNAAYAKGKDNQTKEPIDSVEPLTGIIGMSYGYSDRAFVGLNLKLVAPKKAKDISTALRDNGVTKMPGYGTLDLVGEYRPNDNIRINAGIYNLLDKKHWNWGNRMNQTTPRDVVRGTEPGINAGLSVTISF